MIKIGLETGALANRYIYTYLPESDQLSLDSKLASGLSRTSITCENEFELEQLTPNVLRLIGDAMGMQWAVVTGWKESDPFLTPARARLKEKKLLDRGLEFGSHDGYRVGVSSPLESPDSFLVKELLTTKSYGVCINSQSLLDAKLSCLTDLVRSSARSFAAPEPKSVTSILGESIGAIVYMICDDSVRPGLVILAERTFDTELFEKFGDSVNSKILEGELADQVWAR